MVVQGSSWRTDRPVSQLWVLLRAQCTALLACVTYCLSLTQIRGPNTLGVLVTPLHPPGLCIHHLHLPRTKNKVVMPKIKRPLASSPPASTSGHCAFSWGEPAPILWAGRENRPLPLSREAIISNDLLAKWMGLGHYCGFLSVSLSPSLSLSLFK